MEEEAQKEGMRGELIKGEGDKEIKEGEER